MYIYSTNSIYDRNVQTMPSWYTSEKYYNCESFFQVENKHPKGRSLFGKKASDKKLR